MLPMRHVATPIPMGLVPTHTRQQSMLTMPIFTITGVPQTALHTVSLPLSIPLEALSLSER